MKYGSGPSLLCVGPCGPCGPCSPCGNANVTPLRNLFLSRHVKVISKLFVGPDHETVRASDDAARVFIRGLQAYFSSSVFARTFFGYIPERLTIAPHKDVRNAVILPIRTYA